MLLMNWEAGEATPTSREHPAAHSAFKWDLSRLSRSDAMWAASAAAWLAETATREPDPADPAVVIDRVRRAEELLMYRECSADLGRAVDNDHFELAPALSTELDRLHDLLTPHTGHRSRRGVRLARALAEHTFDLHSGLLRSLPDDARPAATAGHLSTSLMAHGIAAIDAGHPSTVDAAEVAAGLRPGRIDDLVATARSNLPLLHRFLDVRRRLLGLDLLTVADLRRWPAVRDHDPITPPRAYAVVREALRPMGPGYLARMDRVVDEGRVHLVPTSGDDRRRVAHTNSAVGVPSRVFLNWRGDWNDVSSLAHELSHAVHWDSCSALRPDEAPTRIMGEAFAILNELHLARSGHSAGAGEVVVALTLADALARFIFRQTMFVELELWAHRRIGTGIALTSAALTERTASLAGEYYGPVVADWATMAEDWLDVRHLFWNFEIPVYPIAASIAIMMHSARPPLSGDDYLLLLGSGSRISVEQVMTSATTGRAGADSMAAFDDAVTTLERLVPAHSSAASR